MKRLAWSMLVVMILAVVAAFPFGVVAGAGQITESIQVASSSSDGRMYTSTSAYYNWTNARLNYGTVVTNGINMEVGWAKHWSSTSYWNIYRAFLGFDTTVVPDEATIVSVEISIKTALDYYTESLTPDPPREMYLALTAYEGSLNSTGWDYMTANNDYLSDTQWDGDWNHAGGEWVKFTIQDEEDIRDRRQGNDVTYYALRSLNDCLNVQPHTLSFTHYWQFYTVDDATVGNRPYMTVVYTEEGVTRSVTIPANGNTVAEDPAGIIDSIEWESVRAAYSDETIGFKVTGDNGTPLSLKLVNANGTILASKTERIRDNGLYYWSLTLPANTETFIRCYDAVQDITSEWGYVCPFPTNIPQLTTLVTSNDYPQYYDPMSQFLVKSSGKYAVYHWRTDLQDDEHADYDINLNYLGATNLYTDTFAGYGTNYGHGSAANRLTQNQSRYMIFGFGLTGSDTDYDGMIYDLGLSYDASTSGFYDLTASGASRITESHSMIWWVPSGADTFAVKTDKTTYKAGDQASITIQAGTPGKASTNLAAATVVVYDSDGDFAAQTSGGLTGGTTVLKLNLPAVAGQYVMVVTLENSYGSAQSQAINIGINTTSPGGGGAGTTGTGISDWIDTMLGNLGLQDAAGRWFAVILACGLLFFLFRESAALRVVMGLLPLGFAIAAQWVDTWIIVLLALGAGLTVWMLLRKQTSGEA